MDGPYPDTPVAQEGRDQSVCDVRMGQRKHMPAFIELSVLPVWNIPSQNLDDLACGLLRISRRDHQSSGMNVGPILPSRAPEYSIPFMAVRGQGRSKGLLPLRRHGSPRALAIPIVRKTGGCPLHSHPIRHTALRCPAA